MTNLAVQHLIDLDEASDAETSAIGVKGWYLAQLRARGFRTPPGFVVTTHGYRHAINAGGIENRLDQLWAEARRAEPARVQALARKARHLISELRIDAGDAHGIAHRLGAFGIDTEFAVRSSVPEDAVSGPECTGIHTTFTNVAGPDQVISRVQACWASLFGERALAMHARGLGTESPSMAVVVQPMVPADKAGIAVLMTVSAEILIEATFGLGEPIISGAVEPDRYVIDASNARARSITIGRKQIVLPADTHGRHTFAPLDQQWARVLSDIELGQIGEVCSHVATSFAGPHEIEWVIDDLGIAILQARSVDTRHDDPVPSDHRLLTGIGIGLGAATGRIRIVADTDDLESIGADDVIVAVETLPEWNPHLRRAAALVTDLGDEHSHCARMAREYGIPAVVATTDATTTLVNGALVTVDALHGWIFPTTPRVRCATNTTEQVLWP